VAIAWYLQRLLGTDLSGLVILEEMIIRGEWVDVLDVGLAELILTGVWYIWWERRQYVHGENTPAIEVSYVYGGSNQELQSSNEERSKATAGMDEGSRRKIHGER
jgi:hypothetical protein